MSSLRRLLLIAGAALAVSATVAYAEIEKYSDPNCPQGTCLYWWPKLPAQPGWHRDDTASLQFHANAFAPDGATFNTADTVMYARAAYKPLDKAATTLDQFIAQDKAAAKQDQPAVLIADAPALKTGDGLSLKSITYSPPANAQGGSWDRVSYGDEGEFYLVFTISARSKTQLDAKTADYQRFIASYKQKP